MQALQEVGVHFCVAPYEADAQMAYLAKAKLADVVITEDSDLLAYGCPEVLFKLDKSGECDHVRLVDLPLNRSPSFAGFDHDNFIEVRCCRFSSQAFVRARTMCPSLPTHSKRLASCGTVLWGGSANWLAATTDLAHACRCVCLRDATSCRPCRAWASRRPTRASSAFGRLST